MLAAPIDLTEEKYRAAADVVRVPFMIKSRGNVLSLPQEYSLLMLILFILWNFTYLFINNGTLDFANKIKTIDPIGLIFSGIHIYPMLHVSW